LTAKNTPEYISKWVVDIGFFFLILAGYHVVFMRSGGCMNLIKFIEQQIDIFRRDASAFHNRLHHKEHAKRAPILHHLPGFCSQPGWISNALFNIKGPIGLHGRVILGIYSRGRQQHCGFLGGTSRASDMHSVIFFVILNASWDIRR
jgi:hypothetical protein